MKIIYAKNSSGIDEQASFRNPEYFERAQEGATSIIIYGDYPKIAEAYADLNIDIEVRELAWSAQSEKKIVAEGKKGKLKKVTEASVEG